ncbi:hypothetical protein I2W78_14955 [Streptomyces spinoverrucosus]|uniref:tetratricopeptide repeat protein n=1 Tax=Streptomyces spinoverrucosus TaxID=284043 RepID=UPI0018C43E29|nr:hypothetical protein [Streptomyces spinoverrucosus]MBG0853112.1 hypothetical protein [Streptomyces spinoverrucosus]
MQARGKQSVSAGGDIGVAVTGDHNQIHIASPVRSAYWEHVRRIAPRELVGRDEELHDLAHFCTTKSGPAYAWWRAGAWAGKTALMAWFALHPPPGVRIVPFFVTARQRAQNDVVAYGDVVLEQLAELAEDRLPAHLTEATRDAHLLRLYDQAARVCRERGERLVLLVDGLDEDRGVTTGPDAHSIAGILPTRLESGMRVIVTGRLNPPLPSDVPDDHPLRDPQYMRTLTPSPYAQAIRAEAERELKGLLAESRMCRDLLGFVVAAGAGLTATDLAHLSAETPYGVRDVLTTRAGRTFMVRKTPFAGRSVPEVYLLAHDELQEQAADMLGSSEVGRYRSRLHAWYDEYREKSWPSETPDYLLHGYVHMLREHQDVDRLVQCATDPDRQERLLHASGSDGLALAEIQVASELIIEQGGERLHDMLTLAIRRNALEERISKMTSAIPAAWVSVGEQSRGEALARGLPDKGERALALAAVGERLAGEEAARVLAEAEAVARDEADDAARDRLLVRIVPALLRAGHYARAEELATTLERPRIDPDLAHQVVTTLVEAGQVGRIAAMVEALGMSAQAPIHLAPALAECGHVADAESVARSAVAPTVRKVALLRLAAVLSRRKDDDRARILIEDALAAHGQVRLEDLLPGLAAANALEHALDMVKEVTLDERRYALISRMAGESARYGHTDDARSLLRLLPVGPDLSEGAADIVVALCGQGDLDGAFVVARLITEDRGLSRALLALALAMIRAGQVDEALQIGRILAKDDGPIDPLVRISVELAANGLRDRAREVLSDAEDLARRSVSTPAKLRVVAAVSRALSGAGCVEEARSLLEGVEEDFKAVLNRWALGEPGREQLNAAFARALADAGLFPRAELLAEGAGNGRSQERIWAETAQSMIAVGRFEDAERAARTPLKLNRSRLPALVAVSLTAAGEFERAVDLARYAEPQYEAWALAEIAYALHEVGHSARAQECTARAQALARYRPSARAAAALARAMARGGDVSAARAQLGDAEVLGETATVTREKVGALVRAMVALGDFARAEALVDRVLRPSAQATARADLVEAYVEHRELARAEALAGRITGREAARAHLAIARTVPPTRSGLHLSLALHYGWWPQCLAELLAIDPTMAGLVIDAVDRSDQGWSEAVPESSEALY